ncbi:MAG TPA: DUF805 domain-containing protein [Steroidobacter sp.]
MNKWATLYLSPGGRIARQTYWLGVLPFAILGIATAEYTKRGGQIPFELFATVGLLSWWPQGMLISKRLHDVTLSGWWAVLFFIAPFIAEFAGYPELSDRVLMAGLATLFGLGLLPGARGPNRFGSDPLAATTRRESTTT